MRGRHRKKTTQIQDSSKMQQQEGQWGTA